MTDIEIKRRAKAIIYSLTDDGIPPEAVRAICNEAAKIVNREEECR